MNNMTVEEIAKELAKNMELEMKHFKIILDESIKAFGTIEKNKITEYKPRKEK